MINMTKNFNNRLITSIIPKNIHEFEKLLNNCNTLYVEHRLDGLEDLNNYRIDYSNFSHKFVVSLRPKSSGGLYDSDEETRIKILKKAINSGISHVDIEFETEQNNIKSLIQFSHQHNVEVIISSHNFEKTPTIQKLKVNCNKMILMGADIIKYVCKANNIEDGHTMICLQQEIDFPIISFSMGEIGSFTRIVSLLYGAKFSYVSSNRKTAPGQLSAKEMIDLLSILNFTG
ncbi:MAG: 3-dehydroquinate dehydratase [Candidatus Heimdallarchaeota archaeon LC_3]|nr:MAG: 3-dehydroquinate dehydratase [Candidatus Heimdallarchaeota archaeon LC_3]